jgi:hypothetical protein
MGLLPRGLEKVRPKGKLSSGPEAKVPISAPVVPL